MTTAETDSLVAHALRLAGADPDRGVHRRLLARLGGSATADTETLLECAWNAGMSTSAMRSLLDASADRR